MGSRRMLIKTRTDGVERGVYCPSPWDSRPSSAWGYLGMPLQARDDLQYAASVPEALDGHYKDLCSDDGASGPRSCELLPRGLPLVLEPVDPRAARDLLGVPGHGRGLIALRGLMHYLRTRSGLIAMQPFPLQFEGSQGLGSGHDTGRARTAPAVTELPGQTIHRDPCRCLQLDEVRSRSASRAPSSGAPELPSSVEYTVPLSWPRRACICCAEQDITQLRRPYMPYSLNLAFTLLRGK